MKSLKDEPMIWRSQKEERNKWRPTCVLIVVIFAVLFLSLLYLRSFPMAPTETYKHQGSDWRGVIHFFKFFKTSFSFGPVELDTSRQPFQLKLADAEKDTYFTAQLGKKFKSDFFRNEKNGEDGNGVVLNVGDTAELRMRHYSLKGVDCIDVSWRATACVTEVLSDCVDLRDAHWYGGSELNVQEWPLEKVSIPMGPYLAQEMLDTIRYGPVQERYFFNSKGVGIYLEEEIPLFVSINETGNKKLCFEAKYDEKWYFSINNKLPELNYTVCKASDVKSIHQFMSDRYFKKPMGIPNPDVFKYPIWSTWDKYGKGVTQKMVGEFVDNILKHNFPITQVEIDDSWTEFYGDLTFDKKAFPDPKSMVDSMHSKNVSVTLWVHPFVNIDAKSFSFLAGKGWLLMDKMDRMGKGPALTSWWNGKAAGYYDFGNPDAVEYFLFQLKVLKEAYGIDSFKFDAGDTTFLPPVFNAKQQFMNMNSYARLYAETAYKSDANSSRLEVRVGAKTQHLPVMVRFLDRASDWSMNVGLKSIIPSTLEFGILGYPFVLPDYIGGNSWKKGSSELFIRWVQANAFLPFMQLSVEPWGNNETLVKITKDMMNLHLRYSDKLIGLAKDSMKTGYPIIRPLWWIAPTDEAALTVNDQFLVGDDLLVAPVMEKGQTVRRLYLPAGQWFDELKMKTVVGQQWIDYPVTLQDLPHFTKVQ